MKTRLFETYMIVSGADNLEFSKIYKSEILPLFFDLNEHYVLSKQNLNESETGMLSWDQINTIFKKASLIKMKGSMQTIKQKIQSKLKDAISKAPNDVVEPHKIEKLQDKSNSLVDDKGVTSKIKFLSGLAKKNKKVSTIVAAILSTVIALVKDTENSDIANDILDQGIKYIKNNRVEPTLSHLPEHVSVLKSILGGEDA